MLSTKQITSLSKFISLVLRHRPEAIGLQLDQQGWAFTSELISKINATGQDLTTEILEQIVATNSKKRFAFNDDKTKIRASQGHSLEVDLQLEPASPLSLLYHGTGEQSVAAILSSGLEKQGRQHVHLSSDTETALMVGRRHGKPAIFVVNAKAMDEEGHLFYISANNVWLTDHVPAKYLELLDR